MLEVITAQNLAGVHHGFFTRKGGISTGIFAGLNCGRGSSDNSEHVTENRHRVAQHMRVSTDCLVSVHQVHSPDVLLVNAPLQSPYQADAMVSDTPGIALGILTADCQPVLLADTDAGIIGAAHAGWKGAKAGVLQNTVDEMVNIGAHRDRIRAAIGPCITQKSYEVGPDFLEAVTRDDPDASTFFEKGQAGKWQFDLPGYGLNMLARAGVKNAAFTGHCTYSDKDRFFSYRRTCHESEPDYGRLIACISL